MSGTGLYRRLRGIISDPVLNLWRPSFNPAQTVPRGVWDTPREPRPPHDSPEELFSAPFCIMRKALFMFMVVPFLTALGVVSADEAVCDFKRRCAILFPTSPILTRFSA